MTIYTMPDGSTREADCIDIACEVEYLPGKFWAILLSPQFIDQGLADAALESIRKTIPSAQMRLITYQNHEGRTLENIVKEDAKYLEHLEIIQ